MGTNASQRHSDTESDGALASLAVHGDSAAFAVLMSRHRRWAYRFIRRYVDNRADADDVFQDTFIAAWRALPHYHRDRPLEFWLRRIALNKCRDSKRRAAVRSFGNAKWTGGEAPEVIDPSPTPPAILADQQELARLERCVQGLPVSLRSALLLTAVQGLSQKAAARELGVSEKAIELRVYRARSRLLELLSQEDALRQFPLLQLAANSGRLPASSSRI